MILPGWESRNVEISVAWLAARKVSTPRASEAFTHSTCQAVMMASRPKAVENQGMPA